MKTWKRAVVAFACGHCATVISAGQPLLLIQPAGLKHAKMRCHKCAGEPVPAYLPDADEPPPMIKLGTVSLPFDFKSYQVGNDE